MPAPIAHLTIGFSIYRILAYKLTDTRLAFLFGNRWILLMACLFFSMLPDSDSVMGILFQDFGNYHNQGTHSLLSGLIPAAIVGIIVALIRKKAALSWAALCLVSYDLHVLLDFFCYGRGVKLFWPITQQRFISPVLVFYGVRWSDGLMSSHHFVTIINEAFFALIVLPPILYFTRNKETNQ